MIRLEKRRSDQENSRFKNNLILNGRYLLLEMLGKGGFSEVSFFLSINSLFLALVRFLCQQVYKAFDLQDLQFVACKIHQLNDAWSEDRKK